MILVAYNTLEYQMRGGIESGELRTYFKGRSTLFLDRVKNWEIERSDWSK